MEMLGGGATRATGESNHLACLHLIALLHEVLALMTVERLQSIGVLDADAVAVSEIRTRCHYLPIKGCHDFIIRLGLQIYSRMATLAAVGTDHLGIR